MMLLLEAVGWTALVFAGAGVFMGVVFGFFAVAENHPKVGMALAGACAFAVCVGLTYALLGGFK